jgi:hypothetical protein
MRWIICLLLAAAVCASSCGRKPDRAPAQPDAGPPAASAEKEEVQEKRGIGDDVSDFTDYATGKGPIEHGKRIKRRFNKIQNDYNKKLEEQLDK